MTQQEQQERQAQVNARLFCLVKIAKRFFKTHRLVDRQYADEVHYRLGCLSRYYKGQTPKTNSALSQLLNNIVTPATVALRGTGYKRDSDYCQLLDMITGVHRAMAGWF